MKRILCVAVWLGLAVRVASQNPLIIPFASQTYGPDGPWQVVEINIGTNQQPIHLLPGGWFESTILSSQVCGSNSDNCPAANAGVFNVNQSRPLVAPGTVDRPGFIDQWNASLETNVTGNGDLMIDQMTVSASNSGNTQTITIPNFAISLVESSIETLPGGTKFQTQLGFLGLGGTTDNSADDLSNGTQVEGALLTNFLAGKGTIPSASFGLHIGSATFNQPGSLVLGGYDGSRAVGDVGEYVLGGPVGGEPIVPLVDLTLGVMQGGTPFNTTQVGSLYRDAATLNTSEPLSLNPTVPYMQLPLGMCEAVAEFLPVTWDSQIGLYLWNVNDANFARIVNSPASMEFAFARAGQPNLVIQVPFSVLNLTLTAPIVSQPTQYFPCKPSYSKDERFYLGRAFLQSAYLTVNWARGTFTMSQGSGPDSGPAHIQPIQPIDQTIQTSESENFLRSWSAHWNTLPGSGSTSGIPIGAKAGIAVGAISGAVSLVSVITWLIRRRLRQKNGASGSSLRGSPSTASSRARLMSGNTATMSINTLPPGSYGANGRQWYASGMNDVKEMEGNMPMYGSRPAFAPGYGYSRNAYGSAHGYGHYGRTELDENQITELGHNQITELDQNHQITEMQARETSYHPPDSPVEIYGQEIGLIPFALNAEELRNTQTSGPPHVRSSESQSARSHGSSERQSANSHSDATVTDLPAGSLTHHSSGAVPSGRPSVTRNSKGFWEISPMTPGSGPRI